MFRHIKNCSVPVKNIDFSTELLSTKRAQMKARHLRGARTRAEECTTSEGYNAVEVIADENGVSKC